MLGVIKKQILLKQEIEIQNLKKAIPDKKEQLDMSLAVRRLEEE